MFRVLKSLLAVNCLCFGQVLAQRAYILDSSEDIALGNEDIVLDSEGNLLVAGGRIVTYDADMEVLQIIHTASRVTHLRVDHADNLYIAGKLSMGEQEVAKMNRFGHTLWEHTIEGSGTIEVTDMAVDASGNLYLVGYLTGTFDFGPGPNTYALSSAADYSLFLVKYEADGPLEWAFSVDSIFRNISYFPVGPSLAVDVSERIYVTGFFQDTVDFDPGPAVATLAANGYDDAFVARYDSSGQYVYAFQLGSAESDKGYAIAVDSAGNLYVTGYFDALTDFDPGPGVAVLSSPGCFDAFVAKYDADGNYLWAIDIGGESNCTEANGFSIAVDEEGNVYVTGYFFHFGSASVDFDPGPGVATAAYGSEENAFVAKYDAQGGYQWAFGLASGGYSAGRKVLIDEANRIYVFGRLCGTADFDPGPGTFALEARCNAFIAVYDTSGALVVKDSPTRREDTQDREAKQLSLELYPVPLAQHADLMLTLPKAQSVRIELFDPLGRSIALVFKGYLTAGAAHRYGIDGSVLSSGVYVLRVEGEHFVTTKSIVKLR